METEDNKQSHYILRDGSLYSFDPYDNSEEEIGFWQFIKEYRPGSDKLILSRQKCDLCKPGYIDNSGLLLKRIYEVLKLELTDRETEFINECNREPEPENENKVPEFFESDEAYLEYIDNCTDPELKQQAYMNYKKTR